MKIVKPLRNNKIVQLSSGSTHTAAVTSKYLCYQLFGNFSYLYQLFITRCANTIVGNNKEGNVSKNVKLYLFSCSVLSEGSVCYCGEV